MDTKDVLEELVKYKSSQLKLNTAHEKLKLKYKEEVATLKSKLKTSLEHMKKQHLDVVKPLIEEVTNRDQIISSMEEVTKQDKEDIKMLNCIVRMPIMCDQFQKAMRKKLSLDAIKKIERETILHLRQNINAENQE